MRAELGLPSVRGDDEKGGGMMGGFGGSMGGVGGGKGKRPINVKFEIPYFTTSGIQVRYLKIIEPKVGPHAPVLLTQAYDSTAAISIAALGTVHHSIWRYRCTITGRGLDEGRRLTIDIPNQTMKPYKNTLVPLSWLMLGRRIVHSRTLKTIGGELEGARLPLTGLLANKG